MKLHYVLMGALFAFCACSNAHKEQSFVTMLGNDTLAVESYQVDANSVHGTSVVRVPKTTMRSYSMTLTGNGLPESFSLSSGPVGGADQVTQNFRYFDDSVQVVTTRNGSSTTNTVAVSGRPFPFSINMFGVWDYAVHRALSFGGQKELSVLSGRRAIRYALAESAPGTYELSNADHDFGPLYATVDSNKDLIAFDMTATTDKFTARRAEGVDVDAAAKDFAAREMAGHPVGALSVKDSVLATVGKANIEIVYSRPEMRGRKIFGNVVPFDVVWRLGANAATLLTTNRELLFGKTVVKPGVYSLFALPSEKGWKLIVNRQHGQWGTVYDEKQDLARIPLKMEELPVSVEQFTFDVTGQGNRGILAFAWERTKASIPFQVR